MSEVNDLIGLLFGRASGMRVTKFFLFACISWISLNLNAETVKQSGFEYSVRPAADWVQPITVKSNATTDSGSGATWLLSNTQISMLKDNYTRFHHYAVKVNSENGLKDASEFGIYFQPNFQTLDIHAVKRTRSGRQQDLTKKVDIRLLQREESYSQGIYDGGVTAMLLLNDVRVGDIVEFTYSINGRNPIFKNEYFSGFPTNWSIPVGRMFNSLRSDKPLNYKLFNSDKKYFKVTQQKDLYQYTWDQSDVAALYDEGEYPGWFDPYGSVQFSEYASWSGVVDWALDLYQVKDITNPELIRLSDQWAMESQSKKQYVEKVIRYAQNNIRYFGIEIGQNSHKPYMPDTVFERKYGDCKDKTMFINTLLARQGIKAYPALVSSSSSKGIESRLPQPGAFDHVISTFQLDGKDYWIDGTRSFQFGSLDNIGVSDFQRALVVKPGSKNLTTMNQIPLINSLKLFEVYDAQNFQDAVELTATFIYQYGRAEGMRSFLKSDGLDNFSKSFTNFYAKQYPSIQLSRALEIIDDEQKNMLTVKAAFSISDYWDQSKEKYEVPLYGDIVADYITKPSIIARNMPYYFSYPVNLEHNIKVNYSGQVNWNLADKIIKVETDELFYQRDVVTQIDSVQVVHQFRSKQDHIAAADVASYLESSAKIREAIYYKVSIDNAEYTNQSSQDLKAMLKKLLKKNRKSL